MTLDIEKQMHLTLHIPSEINDRYNGALSQLMPGQGTLVGNEDKLRQMMDYYTLKHASYLKLTRR